MTGMLDWMAPAPGEVVESQSTEAVLARQRADAEAGLAAAGPVVPRTPRERSTTGRHSGCLSVVRGRSSETP